MVTGLREHFDLSFVLPGIPFPGVQTEVVPPSMLSACMGRVPVLRRLRDWQARFSDVHFDSYVSRRLPPAKLFQGVSGQCYRSLEVAKRRGCRTVVDSITTHIDDFVEHQKRECAKFNIRPATSEAIRRRTLIEYQRADLIRVLSEHARTTFLERGFKNVVVLRPRIDVAEFPEATFQTPKFRVSFVGLLEPWKGFHYLVDAFNTWQLPDSELIFWGAPGSRPVTHYIREHTSRNPRIQVRPVAGAEMLRRGICQVQRAGTSVSF